MIELFLLLLSLANLLAAFLIRISAYLCLSHQTHLNVLDKNHELSRIQHDYSMFLCFIYLLKLSNTFLFMMIDPICYVSLALIRHS